MTKYKRLFETTDKEYGEQLMKDLWDVQGDIEDIETQMSDARRNKDEKRLKALSQKLRGLKQEEMHLEDVIAKEEDR